MSIIALRGRVHRPHEVLNIQWNHVRRVSYDPNDALRVTEPETRPVFTQFLDSHALDSQPANKIEIGIDLG